MRIWILRLFSLAWMVSAFVYSRNPADSWLVCVDMAIAVCSYAAAEVYSAHRQRTMHSRMLRARRAKSHLYIVRESRYD